MQMEDKENFLLPNVSPYNIALNKFILPLATSTSTENTDVQTLSPIRRPNRKLKNASVPTSVATETKIIPREPSIDFSRMSLDIDAQTLNEITEETFFKLQELQTTTDHQKKLITELQNKESQYKAQIKELEDGNKSKTEYISELTGQVRQLNSQLQSKEVCFYLSLFFQTEF